MSACCCIQWSLYGSPRCNRPSHVSVLVSDEGFCGVTLVARDGANSVLVQTVKPDRELDVSLRGGLLDEYLGEGNEAH
jgi:hypothetical protein